MVNINSQITMKITKDYYQKNKPFSMIKMKIKFMGYGEFQVIKKLWK